MITIYRRLNRLKKKIAITALVIMSALFITGLVLIFSAPSIGQNAGSAAIRNNGGTIDTNQYERIISSTITSYQMGGLVLSLTGGFGLLVSGYAIYKEI